MRLMSFLCVSLLSVAALASERSPSARTDDLISSFKKVKSSAKKPVSTEAVDDVDSSFDFDSITTSLMAPRADKFTPEQREEFKKKFHKLIRSSAFVDTGDFFNSAKLERKPDVVGGSVITVPVHVTRASDDTDMEVGLQWKEQAGVMKVVDVLLDGDSLISDYRNRITSIIAPQGVPGLFETLDQKLAKADAAKTK